MVRLTKAQRQWRPRQVKKPSSIKVMFSSTVLTLEAFVAFFATLAIFGLNFNSPLIYKIIIWVLGLALIGAFLAAPAFLCKPWGYTFGWALQGLLILAGVALPSLIFIGLCFTAAYWYAVRTGERLDRENKEREREQLEWEKQQKNL
ncbi:DUF4233 domain-containing protein [Rothia sp. P6271]|uniref:DUF4233 domain-containing protein n=1 Tax=Rothia sp. P6271 TaxID=3402659 RepID=UPI003ACCC01E